MLAGLSVKNYALIDELEIRFPKGLSIITGETGAGKSILLGALGLVLGSRADSQSLHDKKRKCVIEAEFDTAGFDLTGFFRKHELDSEEKTTVRREITPDGKSRSFINDTPVNLSQLKEFGSFLVDIHSQHETLTLNDSSFQMAVVDAFAQNQETLEKYRRIFSRRKNLLRNLGELQAKEAEIRRDFDYFSFQLNELLTVNLENIDQVSLEEELAIQNNAEVIKSALVAAGAGLSGNDENIISSLSVVKTQLSQISRYSQNASELVKRIESAIIELKDISSEIDALAEYTVFDPSRITEIENTLDELYRLQKKHQVNDVQSLIAIRDEYDSKVRGFGSLSEEIENLKKEISETESELDELAADLRKKRKKVKPEIESSVASDLESLSMPNASLEVVFSESEKGLYFPDGKDSVLFLFTANKGSAKKELHKVASGGELSRLMLSVKSQVSKKTKLPTVIFDEIDTGISGDVAARVGKMMDEMAGHMQVIAITHLPQIASRGEAHFYVYKEDREDKTVSAIRKLGKDERVKEIAKMLSSGKPGEAALKNAMELLRV